MGKVTCFRPSEKAEQAIVSLVKEKKAKNKSDAVNQLIQKALEPQLEFPPKTDDRKIPETTGILVACELRSIPVPYDEPFVLWKPPVDSSVCKTCPKYHAKNGNGFSQKNESTN